MKAVLMRVRILVPLIVGWRRLRLGSGATLCRLLTWLRTRSAAYDTPAEGSSPTLPVRDLPFSLPTGQRPGRQCTDGHPTGRHHPRRRPGAAVASDVSVGPTRRW